MPLPAMTPCDGQESERCVGVLTARQSMWLEDLLQCVVVVQSNADSQVDVFKTQYAQGNPVGDPSAEEETLAASIQPV